MRVPGESATFARRLPFPSTVSTWCPRSVPRSAMSALRVSSTRSAFVQQQPDHRRRPQPGPAGVGVRGGDQRPTLLPGQPHRDGVVRIHPGSRHPRRRIRVREVVGQAVAVERADPGQSAPHRRVPGAGLLLGAHPHIHVHPAGAEQLQAALGQPRPPPEQIPGIRAAGARRAQARQPRRGQQPVPIIEGGQRGELGQDLGDELARHPDGRVPGRRVPVDDGGGGCGAGDVGHEPER